MAFEITNEFIEDLVNLIDKHKNSEIKKILQRIHYADIAEVLDEVSFKQAIYIIKLLDSEKTSEILMELDEDTREKILKNLSAKEIANEVGEMDSDDAADIIGELPEERQKHVISVLDDEKLVAGIEELLSYKDNSAGSLMAKELVKVYETWTVANCLHRIREQAENISNIHSIYVVNKENKLMGRLSLKNLITAKNDQKIVAIYISNVVSVNVNENNEEIAKIMTKYNLEAIPVIDDNNVLLGRITIDDIVDIIKDGADKDYQLAAGLSEDVEADDSIFELIKGRLPWLILGLFGSLCAVSVMKSFQGIMANPQYKALFFFTPLIAAVAGNVGVQSSAIMVQGLANNNIKGSLWQRLLKEISISLINSILLSVIIVSFSEIVGYPFSFSVAVSISLITVIIIASLIGTFVPLVLHKRGIDPALATGPFITTSNDIFGILIYFSIAKLLLGI